MLRTKGLAMMSFLPMHLFLLAALMYFLVSWPLSILTRRIELRLKHGKKSLTP
jgi:ABC-type amino acid transport system permease subunit